MRPTLILTAMIALAAIVWWQANPEPPTSVPQIASTGDATSQPLDQPQSISPWAMTGPVRPEELAGPAGSGLEELPAELVQAIDIQHPVAAVGDRIMLDLGRAGTREMTVSGSSRHANGDVSIHAHGQGTQFERATLTRGAKGMFGRITTEQGLFLVHSDGNGSWLLDLNDPRIDVDPLHDDVLGQPALHPMAALVSQAGHTADLLSSASAKSGQSGLSQIDVMFVYTPDMLERYPDGLIETRLNHLVAIANQAMVDSQVPIVVRLVHHESIDYTRHRRNADALQDMARALRGQSVPGMNNLLQARDQHGADIVALTWPHDIETRGSCGMAFFPRPSASGGYDRSLGVHIDNDGVSNWSVCSDAVFTHELGHNLNAEHQREQSSGDDPDRSNYAFIQDRRFHTVMGSFGTGDVNRYLRLDVFSNPDIQCGGQACGSDSPGQGADNAAAISAMGPVVAAYSAPVSPGMVERPAPSNPDSDNDGVVDWLDPYPFDPFDGQGDPNPPPAFVFEARQSRTPENLDDWELLVVSSASDQVLSYGLDSTFRGVMVQPEAVNPGPILTEFSDMLLDDAGRIYLLASEDVRRYDRLSGSLVDIWLDSALPEPRQLQTSFPRAMTFISGNRLVVLGDPFVERFDSTRRRLNFGGSETPLTNPSNWNDAIAMPLRAAGYQAERLYIAEADSNSIMVFNTETGQRLLGLAPPNNPQIQDPRDIVFSPDGLLLLANGRSGNVLRYDVTNRRFVDEFVASGSGGLEFARALAFGPDGHLYVACQESHRILRFDGETGVYLGDLVESGQNGLAAPTALAFAPVIDQIHAGHSGHFYAPGRSGEGWLIEVLDDSHATLGWFTYPTAEGEAEQAWIVGYGAIDGNRITYDDVLITRNGRFASTDSAVSPDVEVWGRIELEFSNCEHGTVHYQGPPEFGSGSHAITRLIRTHGRPCGSVPSGPEPGAPGISGQWYDPDVSSQGWFFEEIEPGQVFVAWFTYDPSGEQAWIVGTGAMIDQTIYFDELLITRGTQFGPAFDQDQVERLDWGTMQINFADCNSAVLEYDSIDPAYGSGVLFPVRLSEIDGLACALPDQ